MAAMRATSGMIMRNIFSSTSLSSLKPVPMFRTMMFPNSGVVLPRVMAISYSAVLRSAAGESSRKNMPARLFQFQQMLHQVVERTQSAQNEPIPKITTNHVVVKFAGSGGPGGQNVNKVNTKVDMRFNVKEAQWLSDRVRERIMQVEKNRINKDGEIVMSSTKTRTQKGNIEDALGKLQAIIDAASYVPPSPSAVQLKEIAIIVAMGEQKRLQGKKVLLLKKALRRNQNRYD